MENKYYPTVGLEIHAELSTKTKMFCSCKNDPDEKSPNVNICPVCMAHPGTLPVVNKKTVENVIRVGLAVGGNIADFTEFDRKNYFYPDIPKGYQISQYKYPIVSGGRLADFDITRVHLEEDTANNKHDRGDFSLVDFNRAGVPLMELVTEPHTFDDSDSTAKSASFFAKELQLLLWYLRVSEANMEKGEMRVEANISISNKKGELGTKVEVKNLNSFKSVEKAIKYEVERMIELYENGKENEIVQETRGWDDAKQKTFSQRKKESSQDYRYFPDPDIPKFKLSEVFDLEKMKAELPVLPSFKREKYKNDFGVKSEDVEVYINDPTLAEWFDEVINILNEKEQRLELIKIASNLITSDYIGIKKTKENINLPKKDNFVELVLMFKRDEISSRVTKDILLKICQNDSSPRQIAEKENLLQTSNIEELKSVAKKVIELNKEAVISYKGGKENALMSLVGQIMKETKGSANPQKAREVLIELLK
ncbi:MAG: Asp-tRNA(Asn)/Glu-tRNA(Gln) amidotransferase subunit GatB [Candidatus Paceibacterota bacterium]|jgi:aspartyl-tRNA(Asn)/glutamyl-tRNA(Gln) amidotransferase subunit B